MINKPIDECSPDELTIMYLESTKKEFEKQIALIENDLKELYEKLKE